MREKDLTFAQVSAVLRFDGVNLIWRVTRGNRVAGTIAGCLDCQGYVVLQCLGVYLQGHRVVWLLTHGSWPADLIDHIDGNRSNNDPRNLRECNHTENHRNRRSVGRTHFKGVTWHKQAKRYQVTCAHQYIGLFKDAEDAARAYDAAALERFGAFARLNFGSAA